LLLRNKPKQTSLGVHTYLPPLSLISKIFFGSIHIPPALEILRYCLLGPRPYSHLCHTNPICPPRTTQGWLACRRRTEHAAGEADGKECGERKGEGEDIRGVTIRHLAKDDVAKPELIERRVRDAALERARPRCGSLASSS
jgi:hypothetical protein